MTDKDNDTIDNMLKGHDLILINDDKDENPKYRILVQTPGELDYSDMGIGKINYKEEAIKEAMSSLVGYDIVDELTEHERKLGIKPKSFAHIYNTDYCPKYGGYADIEVFNDDYKPVLANMLKHKDTTKRKFSTEVNPLDILKVDEKAFDLNKYNYDGIVMTTRPRDEKTGLCDVIVNSKDFKEDETVTDKIEIDPTELNELKEFKTKYNELKPKYDEGKKLYENMPKKPEDFKEYNEAQTEIKDLKQQLIPIWNQIEEDKVALVNSLVNSLPDDKKEGAKERYEKMELEDLKLIKLTNSTGEPAPGVTGRGAGSGANQGNDEKKKHENVKSTLKDIGFFD